MTDRPRRAKPAAATRLLVSGLSASATLGIVGGLAVGDAAGGGAAEVATESVTVAPEPEPAPIVRVVVRVHHPAPREAASRATRRPSYVVPPPKPAIRKVYVRRTRPAPPPVTTSHGSR